MLKFTEIEELKGQKAPLFRQYDGQMQPQPAYIMLYTDGRVLADYSGEIGNATPADVWNGVTLRWAITPLLSGDAIVELLMDDDTKALLERVAAGHDTEWDGSNYVGTLTADAQAASEALEALLSDAEPDVQNWNTGDWLFGNCDLFDHWPADKSLADAVAEIEQEADQENIVLSGDVEEALLEDAQHLFRLDKRGLDTVHLDALVKHEYATLEEVEEYIENTKTAE